MRVGILVMVLVAATAWAGAPEWRAVAAVEEIEVLTQDEDGSPRETTIWLAVVDGQGYIRTGSTTWGANVQRNPDIALRIEGAEYPVRAHFVEDDAVRATVVDTFREKYGWFDGLINVVRGSRPLIMRIEARE